MIHCVNAMLLMLAAIRNSAAHSETTILQANARGMACAQWNYAGSGVPKDCVWHHPKTSSQLSGSPWFGALNSSTGVCAAIKGVTDVIGGMQVLHGNFIALDPHHPLDLIGFANPNYTYYFTDVHLPASDGEIGSVDVLSKVAEPAVWIESASAVASDCMLSWSYVETIEADSLNLTETLSCVDPHSFKTTILWSNSTSPTEGLVPPSFFGAEHAVDLDTGVLYTQSEKQSMGRFDLKTRKVLDRLDTSGKRIECLHYDSYSSRLGGIVRDASLDVDASSSIELVSIDIDTGIVTTRLKVPDFPSSAASGLSLYYIDPSAGPGDGFSPVTRPACSFDNASGMLAFLLVDEDTDVKPAFANKKMYVCTMNVRTPTAPSQPVEIKFPFVAAAALGNRTWRPTMPGLSFL